MTIKKLLQYILLSIFVVLIVYYFKNHQKELFIIRNLNIAEFLFLFFLNIFIYLLYAYRLFLIMGSLGLKKMRLLYWLKVFSISQFINFHVTQGSLIYRGVKLKKDFNFSYTSTFSTNVYFAWLDTLSILLLSLGIISFYNEKIYLQGINIQLILTVFIAIFAGAFYLLKNIKITGKPRGKFLSHLVNRIINFQTLLSDSHADLSLSLKLLALNVLNYFLQILWFFACIQALDLQMSIPEVIIIFTAFYISSLIKIVPGNLGIKEMLGGFLTESFGLSFGNGILISGISRVFIYVTIGTLCLVFAKFSGNETKHHEPV